MRLVKLTAKVIAIALMLFLLLFTALSVYVYTHKQSVFTSIKDQLDENINGSVTIGEMDANLFSGFPSVSVTLKNVRITDSLWHLHKHTLLDAGNVYVAIKILPLLTGNINIRDVRITNGAVYLFTDSTGYSNTSVFGKKKDKRTTDKDDLPKFNHLYISNVSFAYINKTKFKDFSFNVGNMEASWDYTAKGWDARLNMKTTVKSMTFNTVKGSFIENKLMRFRLRLSYDNDLESLIVPEQPISIDKETVKINAQFSFRQVPANFVLNIDAENIEYKKGLSMLTPAISSKIDMFDLQQPIEVKARIHGTLKYRDTPNVSVTWTVKDNSFITPAGTIENCSFTGTYMNERVNGKGYKDNNALLTIQGLKGNWFDIPFSADTVSITDLTNPVFEGRFTSSFNLEKLNPLIGYNTFNFSAGTVAVDVLYKGGIRNNDTTQPYLSGSVSIADASFSYLPRQLTFTHGAATLNFLGSDLEVTKVHVQKGTTTLNMNGSMRNFLNLYYTAPEKILLDWQVQSPLINLNEFVSLLAVRKSEKVTTKTKYKSVNSVSDQLDKMLAAANVHMQVNVDRILYKYFEASRLHGDVTMAGTDIIAKDFEVQHADGKLKLNATIHQSGTASHYDLSSSLEHVNVKKLFSSFDNFGQSAITDNNVLGDLSATVKVAGYIADSGKLIPRTMKGIVTFNFADGHLNNFTPFKTIGNLLFRRRNMDSIAFRDIEGKLKIEGDKVFIYPLYIESSAINMNIEGTYAITDTGTNIDMVIPLRNPAKDELIMNDQLRRQRNMKGINLHLKAVDGKDGNAKIIWDPLH